MKIYTAGTVATTTLIVLTACGTPGVPTAGARVTLAAPSPTPMGEQTKAAEWTQWVYFVSWSGVLSGSPITGMTEASIEGSPRTWDKILEMVARVQAANPGVEQVKIVSYNLMRIE
jgi:hypothetical protein